MAVRLLDTFNQFLDANGDPLDGGFVYTYTPNGTTPLATYTDTDGVTAHENPIELDSDGRPPSPIYWTEGAAYNVVLKTSGGVTVDSIVSFLVPSSDAPTAPTFYEVIGIVAGNPSDATQWLGGERFARAVDFLANWSGSYGKAPLTNPVASYTITVKKNGSTVGTIVISTAGAYTFATSGGAAVSFAAGDYIDFYGPASADGNIANFGWTLVGELG